MNGELRSVNITELEDLYQTLRAEATVLDEGFTIFINTVEALKQNRFIQGRLELQLGDVRKRLEGVRISYTQCIGNLSGAITRTKETALETESKYYSGLVDIASVDPLSYGEAPAEAPAGGSDEVSL